VQYRLPVIHKEHGGKQVLATDTIAALHPTAHRLCQNGFSRNMQMLNSVFGQAKFHAIRIMSVSKEKM
jgi:hypothetical protein